MSAATPAFVLDGSVALAWSLDDEVSAFADDVLMALSWCACVVPSIWLLEIGNVFLVAERRGRIPQAETVRLLGALSALPIEIEPADQGRVFRDTVDLARTHHLSVYDAAYLELALRRGLPLATLDVPVRQAATTVGVSLFQPPAKP